MSTQPGNGTARTIGAAAGLWIALVFCGALLSLLAGLGGAMSGQSQPVNPWVIVLLWPTLIWAVIMAVLWVLARALRRR